MSCEPERVTAFVDGELDPPSLAAVAAHVADCPACRAQVEAEREIRARLRALPSPGLPHGLEQRVRSAASRRPAGARLRRWALPLAAALVFAAWARGSAPFVAWDLARDHDKCFSRRPVPAVVRSGDPAVVESWFAAQGTRVPRLPARVGDLRLVGARYCPLASLSFAPHVYYSSLDRHLSIFVMTHGVRVRDRYVAGGRRVRLLRLEGDLVGIVAEHESDLQAVETALRPVVAGAVRLGGRTGDRSTTSRE